MTKQEIIQAIQDNKIQIKASTDAKFATIRWFDNESQTWKTANTFIRDIIQGAENFADLKNDTNAPGQNGQEVINNLYQVINQHTNDIADRYTKAETDSKLDEKVNYKIRNSDGDVEFEIKEDLTSDYVDYKFRTPDNSNYITFRYQKSEGKMRVLTTGTIVVDKNDLATKQYVDDQITGGDSGLYQLRTINFRSPLNYDLQPTEDFIIPYGDLEPSVQEAIESSVPMNWSTVVQWEGSTVSVPGYSVSGNMIDGTVYPNMTYINGVIDQKSLKLFVEKDQKRIRINNVTGSGGTVARTIKVTFENSKSVFVSATKELLNKPEEVE